MECPTPKCRETLIAMINKKVNKVVLITAACCIVGASGGFILYGLAAEKEQNNHINSHNTQIKVIEADIRVIKESIKRVEEKQFSKSELVEAIKKALEK